MGRRERDKGKRGELEVRDIFRAAGFGDAERTPNSGGLFIPGDVALGVEDLHVEAKRHERLDIPGWLRQTYADCPPGALPILAFRKSRTTGAGPVGRWHGAVPLDRLAELLHAVHRR